MQLRAYVQNLYRRAGQISGENVMVLQGISDAATGMPVLVQSNVPVNRHAKQIGASHGDWIEFEGDLRTYLNKPIIVHTRSFRKIGPSLDQGNQGSSESGLYAVYWPNGNRSLMTSENLGKLRFDAAAWGSFLRLVLGKGTHAFMTMHSANNEKTLLKVVPARSSTMNFTYETIR